MTYNVQWFSGQNSQLNMQKEIINKYDAHIIGLQELSTNGKINSVGRSTFVNYPYQFLSKHKNYMGLVSKYKLKNVKSYDFKTQDPKDIEQYNETRAYMTATLEIGGKQIKIINTHLCHLTPSIKYLQMKKIFNIASRAEYTIIMGDFNCFMKELNDEEYNNMYKQFVDAGYNLANCTSTITKTWTNNTNPKSLSEFTFPTDNIIVSNNITIKKVIFDKTKLKYPNGKMLDHIPIIVRLEIE